jgi:hypothetical protein
MIQSEKREECENWHFETKHILMTLQKDCYFLAILFACFDIVSQKGYCCILSFLKLCPYKGNTNKIDSEFVCFCFHSNYADFIIGYPRACFPPWQFYIGSISQWHSFSFQIIKIYFKKMLMPSEENSVMSH